MSIFLSGRGIELKSGFVSGTYINNGEVMVDIHSVKNYPGAQVEMFALNNQMDVINTVLVSVTEDYTSDIWCLDLSSGHHIECVDTTIFFDMNLKWRTARSFSEGDKLVGMIVEESNMHGEPFFVTKSYKKPASLACPVYYFETIHHNMLLPHFSESEKKLTFICTHQ